MYCQKTLEKVDAKMFKGFVCVCVCVYVCVCVCVCVHAYIPLCDPDSWGLKMASKSVHKHILKSIVYISL